MKALEERDLDALKFALIRGDGRNQALASTIGGFGLCNGVFRVFSGDFPKPLGAARWNDPSGWRAAWPKLSKGKYFFGEDIWGNQLALVNDNPNIVLFGHEDSSMFNTGLEAVDFFDAILKYQLSWTDYYSDEMLAIGEKRAAILPDNSHLHWTTPLVLGGAVSENNISIAERFDHLTLHGKLWQQIGDLPPGTEIIIK